MNDEQYGAETRALYRLLIAEALKCGHVRGEIALVMHPGYDIGIAEIDEVQCYVSSSVEPSTIAICTRENLERIKEVDTGQISATIRNVKGDHK